MNDLGRRYYLFATTPRGKQRILGTMIALACVINLVVSTYGRDHWSSHTVGTLFAFSGGLLLAAIVFLIMTRSRR